jgi:hypothetical protein
MPCHPRQRTAEGVPSDDATALVTLRDVHQRQGIEVAELPPIQIGAIDDAVVVGVGPEVGSADGLLPDKPVGSFDDAVVGARNAVAVIVAEGA